MEESYLYKAVKYKKQATEIFKKVWRYIFNISEKIDKKSEMDEVEEKINNV